MNNILQRPNKVVAGYNEDYANYIQADISWAFMRVGLIDADFDPLAVNALGDVQEASFTGYARQNTNKVAGGALWTPGVGAITFSPITWTFGGGIPARIFGHFLLNDAVGPGRFINAIKWSHPATLFANLDVVTVSEFVVTLQLALDGGIVTGTHT